MSELLIPRLTGTKADCLFAEVGFTFCVLYRAPVAQLVEHRAATQEVVSSTPAGPTLRVLK